MKNKFFKLFIIASTSFYAFTLISTPRTSSDWEVSGYDEEEQGEEHAYYNPNLDEDLYDFTDYEDLLNAYFKPKPTPSTKITLEQIEQAKFPDPKYLTHLEVTRENKDYPVRADLLRSLVHLYPNIKELTLTGLNLTPAQAQEFASHFHNLSYKGPTVK